MFWRNKRKIDFWWLSSDTRLFEKITLKALAFCPRLPNIHPRFSSFDWFLVHRFLGELLYFLTGNLRESGRHFFWKQKQKRNCVQCCHGNLVIPSIFAIIPLLSPGQTIATFQLNTSQHCWASICKLRPNDRNISAQNIATLLGATCWARLVTLLRRVATCRKLKIELVRMPRCSIVVRAWPNDYNIMQHRQML